MTITNYKKIYNEPINLYSVQYSFSCFRFTNK